MRTFNSLDDMKHWWVQNSISELDWDTQVYKVEIPNRSTQVIPLSPHEISPVNASLIVCWERNVQNKVVLIGYLKYLDWKGRALLSQLETSCAGAYCLMTRTTSLTLEPPSVLFYFPHWYALHDTDVWCIISQEDFFAYIQAIGHYYVTETIPPASGKACHVAAGFFGKTIHDSASRVAFERARLALERTRFFTMCNAHVTTEAHWLRLMQFNQLDSLVTMVEGTRLDEQAYFERHRHRFGASPCDVPSVYFQVPLVEAGPDLSHLPLYKGGYVHLSWRDMPQWVFNKYTQWNMHMYFDMALLQHEWFIEAEALWTLSYEQPKPEPKPVTQVMEINDYTYDQLVNSMPPCLAAIHNQGCFPKHYQRLDMVVYFVSIGASDKAITRYFRRMNKAFPKEDDQELEKRFNLEYFLKKQRTKTYVRTCKRILERYNQGGIKCPFQKQMVPDIEDLLKLVQHQCAPPTRKTPFNGPHVLARAILLQKK